MSCSPVRDFQTMPQGCMDQPHCDESLFFDDTWKSGYNSPHYSEDSNNSLSDCVPDSMPNSFGMPPVAQSDYNAITGSNALLGNQVDAYRWQTKNPATWDHLDVALWLQYMADSLRLANLRSEVFADIDGPTMCKMQMEQFQDREPSYGSELYMAFTQLINSYQPQYQQQSFVPNGPTHEQPRQIQEYEGELTSIERYIGLISFDQDDKFRSLPSFESLLPKTANKPVVYKPTCVKAELSDDIDSDPPSPANSEGSSSSTGGSPKGGRRGRSKGKLWEFVRSLLLDDETNPSIIRWEDRTNGVFRIVRSDLVAKRWGDRKSNPTMTYEKMSRAMRYYYRKEILERIDGRRLVYKFGPNSRGWQL